MARTANRFTDPNTGAIYDWPINHIEEQQFGKSRNISSSAPTALTGLIPQQGASSPLTLVWKGTILTRAQVVEMIRWWQLCESQTIYVRDFAGDEYEVLITDFNPTRQPVMRNSKDPVNAPLWKWEYTISMRVITIRSGVWAGVTP